MSAFLEVLQPNLLLHCSAFQHWGLIEEFVPAWQLQAVGQQKAYGNPLKLRAKVFCLLTQCLRAAAELESLSDLNHLSVGPLASQTLL